MGSAAPLVVVDYVDARNEIAHVRLNRPAKRNALSDAMVEQLRRAFVDLKESARVVILSGEGEHFCAGLDLSELTERDAVQGLHHSRSWHFAFQELEFGRVPVIAVLHGAVAGGGLELAATAHIRVADPSTYFALPEGQRGIYVGGGASVRVPKLIGANRMMDMMLTGRIYKAEEAVNVGFMQYLTAPGEAFAQAKVLAEKIAGNSPVTNYAVTHVLPRIDEMSAEHGYLMEALMAGIAGNSPEAKRRLHEFLSGKAAKIKPQ